MYQLRIHLHQQDAFRAEAAMDGMALAITIFEEPGQQTASAETFAERWTLDAIFASKPDVKSIQKILRAANCNWQKLTCEKLPPTDWLKLNQESFPPIRAGRFYIKPSDRAETRPSAHIVTIDAATAFGTGHHATTYGCLLALNQLARHIRPNKILDMGCGTAILAMAAARQFPFARFMAADIDAEAVRVARINCRVNHLGGKIHCLQSRGFAKSAVRAAGRQDVIFANILAKPLTLMAVDVRRQITRGGYIILSGLLANQERAVLAAYHRHGMRFCGRIAKDGWHTLILQG